MVGRMVPIGILGGISGGGRCVVLARDDAPDAMGAEVSKMLSERGRHDLILIQRRGGRD